MTRPKTTLLFALLSACLAIGFPGVGSCRAQDRDTNEPWWKTLARRPELAPEKCTELPPDKLWEKLQLPGTGSLAAEDAFHIAYQHQLQKFTDARYPRAKQYRHELQAAFESMMNFVMVVWRYQGNFGHTSQRVGAQVERAIYEAERDKFEDEAVGGVVSAVGVEEAALKIARQFGTGLEDESLLLLHDSIRHLMKATAADGESIRERRAYFSRVLADFVAGFDRKLLLDDRKAPATKP